MFVRIYTRLKRLFFTSFLIKGIIRGSKKIFLPGFDGLPLYDVGSFFLKGLQQGYLTTRAASMSFKFFMALFPALIFLFTLIPYIPVDGFQSQLLSLIHNMLPNAIAATTNSTIRDLITHQRGGLLSFGFVFTIYYSTSGIAAMINAFNLSYNIDKTSKYFKRLGRAFTLLFALTILMIVAIGLIVFSGVIINYLKQKGIVTSGITIFLLNFGKWVIIILFYLVSVSSIYYLGGEQTTKWRFVSAGSTLASIASIAVSLGFAFYVNHFGKYNKLYGSLGVLIVLMMWIYLNSLVLLIGFELNASILQAKFKGRH